MRDMVFVKYNDAQERKDAFLRSVNLRKEWESKMRTRMQEDISVMFHDFAVNLPSKLYDLQNGI